MNLSIHQCFVRPFVFSCSSKAKWQQNAQICYILILRITPTSFLLSVKFQSKSKKGKKLSLTENLIFFLPIGIIVRTILARWKIMTRQLWKDLLFLFGQLTYRQKQHHVKGIPVSLYSERQLHIKSNKELPDTAQSVNIYHSNFIDNTLNFNNPYHQFTCSKACSFPSVRNPKLFWGLWGQRTGQVGQK